MDTGVNTENWTDPRNGSNHYITVMCSGGTWWAYADAELVGNDYTSQNKAVAAGRALLSRRSIRPSAAFSPLKTTLQIRLAWVAAVVNFAMFVGVGVAGASLALLDDDNSQRTTSHNGMALPAPPIPSYFARPAALPLPTMASTGLIQSIASLQPQSVQQRPLSPRAVAETGLPEQSDEILESGPAIKTVALIAAPLRNAAEKVAPKSRIQLKKKIVPRWRKNSRLRSPSSRTDSKRSLKRLSSRRTASRQRRIRRPFVTKRVIRRGGRVTTFYRFRRPRNRTEYRRLQMFRNRVIARAIRRHRGARRR